MAIGKGQLQIISPSRFSNADRLFWWVIHQIGRLASLIDVEDIGVTEDDRAFHDVL